MRPPQRPAGIHPGDGDARQERPEHRRQGQAPHARHPGVNRDAETHMEQHGGHAGDGDHEQAGARSTSADHEDPSHQQGKQEIEPGFKVQGPHRGQGPDHEQRRVQVLRER